MKEITEIKRLRDEEKFIISKLKNEVTLDYQVVEAAVRLGVYEKCLAILEKT